MSSATDSPWTDDDVETATWYVLDKTSDLSDRQPPPDVVDDVRETVEFVLDALAPRVAELQRAAKAEVEESAREQTLRLSLHADALRAVVENGGKA